MIKHQIGILCALSSMLLLNQTLIGFEIGPVDPIGNLQQTPDVDNNIVVWAEQVEGDWDVYGFDLSSSEGGFISIAASIASNQNHPGIWNNYVVWQDDELGDWDIWLADIYEPANPAYYYISPYVNDQTHPAIHGNTIVWQDEYTVDDWDIYAADITEPNNALVYVVDDLTENQTVPNVYRSTIVYQDDYYDHSDIISADVWVKNSPEYQEVISDQTGSQQNQTKPAVWGDIVVYEQQTASGDIDLYARDMSRADSEPFLVSGGAGLQQAPDISNHLIVWQDNRNGNFDIYGYNLITKEEFRITTDGSDQTNPTINGTLVAWEDARVTPANIYYTWLDGDVIADCPIPLKGDVDGDCRVDLVDFALMAESWLICNLEPATACN